MANSNHTIRDDYWDTVKALLIFLVIFGHMIQFFMYHGKTADDFWTDPVFKGIYLFHMPLFMMVSGYFAARSVKRHSWKSIPRYLQRLALPCLGMAIIYLIISLIQGSASISAFGGGGVSLWFLIVAFECVVGYLLMQVHGAWWYKLFLFIIPIPIAVWCSTLPVFYTSHSFYTTLNQFTYLWPIFIIGAVLSSSGFSHNKINWKWGFFLLGFIPLYFLFQPTWYVYKLPLEGNLHSVLINIFRTMTAIIGSGAVL